MSPKSRKIKYPNTGRLQNVAGRDDDGAVSNGVANLFMDDYS